MRRSEASPRPRRRLLLTVSGASVVLAITAGAVVWTGRHGQESRASADENVHVTTAVVERADLSDTRTLGGTLGHGRSRVVRSGKEGLVTWLPRIGAEVTRGGQLFRVNDNPVPLLYGSTPLYRTLRDEGTVGRDVKVLVDNLRKLGYDFGEQPEVGSWVRPRPAATPASDGAGAEGRPRLPMRLRVSPPRTRGLRASPARTRRPRPGRPLPTPTPTPPGQVRPPPLPPPLPSKSAAERVC